MTVLRFPRAPQIHNGLWRPDEMADLARSCTPADASGWETGSTERGDPQFYVIGPPPEQECLFCVSRVGRLYVLADGEGRVLLEHDNLVPLAEHIHAALRKRKQGIVARIAVAWCAAREFFEEKVEPLVAEPAELLTHFAPQLAAFA